MTIHTPSQSGFTLIETLIALTIFSISLVALMTIASQGIRATGQANDQIISQYLAQEGIELVMTKRAQNFLTPGNAWDDGLTACFPVDHDRSTGDNGWCRMDSETFASSPTSDFVACNDARGCPVFFYDENSGVYSYDSLDTTSRFRRLISIEPITDSLSGSEDHASIISRVEWERGGRTYHSEVSSFVTNWLKPAPVIPLP